MPHSYYKRPKRNFIQPKKYIYYPPNTKIYFKEMKNAKDIYVEIFTRNETFEVYIRPKRKQYGYIVVITDSIDKAINVAENLEEDYFYKIITDLVTFY